MHQFFYLQKNSKNITSHFLNSHSKSAYIKMIIIILNNYYLKCYFSLIIKCKYKIIYIFNLNIF